MAVVLKLFNNDELTSEQISALEEHLGEKVYLFELPKDLRQRVFKPSATDDDLEKLGKEIAEVAASFDAVILPAAVSPVMFCFALQARGKLIHCLFAHSRGEAAEEWIDIWT